MPGEEGGLQPDSWVPGSGTQEGSCASKQRAVSGREKLGFDLWEPLRTCAIDVNRRSRWGSLGLLRGISQGTRSVESSQRQLKRFCDTDCGPCCY